jgi:hypothetical protein
MRPVLVLYAVAAVVGAQVRSDVAAPTTTGRLAVEGAVMRRADRGGQRKPEDLSRKDPEQQREDDFLRSYLALPPGERIKLWRKPKGIAGQRLAQTGMNDSLVARGLDTVPCLAEFVRSGHLIDQIRALTLLCDMDRFVPLADLVLPEVGDTVYVKALRLGGRLNQFMKVDGRRIGKEGFEVVQWAAEQTRDKELRFHARECSGLLDEDLSRLSLGEQVSKWSGAIAKAKGPIGMVGETDTYSLAHHLSRILVERAPESLPLLTHLLESDPNGYVREETLGLLDLIDSCRMRLRATEGGLKAVETIHTALERGGLKPVYEKRPEWRKVRWEEIRAEVFDDQVRLDNSSDWSLIALAFEKFYGVKATKRSYTVTELIEAVPEFRQFVTYLTKVDPSFPGWEYTYIGLLRRDQVLHPRFKEKIARYYEQWKRFKAEN